MKEPVKYRKNEKGNWVLTEEWKEWRKQKLGKSAIEKRPNKKQKFAGRPKEVTSKNHKYNWKVVAWSLVTPKQVLFCCCRSNNANEFYSCGAVARLSRPGAKLEILRKPILDDLR